MRFWDSSALVPLVVSESATPWARAQMKSDRQVVIWSLSGVEIRSALARKLDEGRLDLKSYRSARQRAVGLLAALAQVTALEPVRDRALRLLDVHRMRAADALQLAAALVASGENPSVLAFVTLDARLGRVAEQEGFAVETTAP